MAARTGGGWFVAARQGCDLSRLALDPDARLWRTRVRPVPSGARRRLPAVGADRARAVGWPDQRLELVPRHRDALSSLRSTARAAGLSGCPRSRQLMP